MVNKYVKKPLEIEAIKWTGDNFIEVDEFVTAKHETFPSKGIVIINTLEGDMAANKGDYIIKGIKGEFYPCKEDIFLDTYYRVEVV